MKVTHVRSTALSAPLERPIYVGNKDHLVSRFNPLSLRSRLTRGYKDSGIAFAEEDRRVRTLKTAVDELSGSHHRAGCLPLGGSQKLYEASGHMGHRYGICPLGHRQRTLDNPSESPRHAVGPPS